MCACAAPRLERAITDGARWSAGRRRSGRARCSRGCTTRSRARAASRAPGSARGPACTCWRFEAIDGSAVAGPVATSRNADERRQSRNEEWGRSPCEERHAASRSPVDRPADGGVTGHKSGSLAARSDVCTPNRRENICKQPGIPVRTVTGPVRGRGRYLVPLRGRSAPRMASPARRSRSRAHARELGLARRRAALAPSSSCTPPSRALARARGGAARLESRRRALDARVARTRRHVDGRAQLARSDQREGRDTAPPAVRRGRARPDRRPARGAARSPAVLAGIDELERATLVNRGIAAELGARSRTLQTQLARLSRLARAARGRRAPGARRPSRRASVPPTRAARDGRRHPAARGRHRRASRRDRERAQAAQRSVHAPHAVERAGARPRRAGRRTSGARPARPAHRRRPRPGRARWSSTPSRTTSRAGRRAGSRSGSA